MLQHIFAFFALLASYEEENKMSSFNIAVVMAPIMLPPVVMDMAAVALQGRSIAVIQAIIDNSKIVFEDIKLRKQQLLDEEKKE